MSADTLWCRTHHLIGQGDLVSLNCMSLKKGKLVGNKCCLHSLQRLLFFGYFMFCMDHYWEHMTAKNHSDDGYVAWAEHNSPPSLFIQYDISAPPPSSVCISPVWFKHVYHVMANLLISLAPVRRLFIILQFGRVQIFSLDHSLEQTSYYCWIALATKLVGPEETSEALLPLLSWVRQQTNVSHEKVKESVPHSEELKKSLSVPHSVVMVRYKTADY